MILPGNADFLQFSKRSVDIIINFYYIGPGQRFRTDKGSFTYLPLSSKVRDRVSRQIHVAQVQVIHLIPGNNIFKAV